MKWNRNCEFDPKTKETICCLTHESTGEIICEPQKNTINPFTLLVTIAFLVSLVLGFLFYIHSSSIADAEYFMCCDGVEQIDDDTIVFNRASSYGAITGNVEFFQRMDYDGYSATIMWDIEKDEEIWRYEGNADHCCELMDDMIFVSDNDNNRFYAIDIDSKEIVWEYDLKEMNWTAINSEWGGDHRFNNPPEDEDEYHSGWSHTNDLDFKDYGTWTSILFDIRNFNMTLEVNYTSAFTKDTPDPSDVTWWYIGDMYHQHNPDYLPNGNIVISDSSNQRIIEVNYTTKDLEWEWTSNRLDWARDADLVDNNTYMITDIDEIFIVNVKTDEIIWEYTNIFGLYEADMLDNGNILVSGGMNGRVFIIDYDTKEIVWQYGHDTPLGMALLFAIPLIGFESYFVISIIVQKNKQLWILLPLGLLIFIHIVTLFFVDEIFFQLFSLFLPL